MELAVLICKFVDIPAKEMGKGPCKYQMLVSQRPSQNCMLVRGTKEEVE